jgi:hypothetical protein
MTPADIVIARFDGVRPLARLLGKDPSTIHRWKMPASKGGLDGRVPSSVQLRLLELAREGGIALTADELINGVREINAAPANVDSKSIKSVEKIEGAAS